MAKMQTEGVHQALGASGEPRVLPGVRVVAEGRGLHTGAFARVTLTARSGPVTLSSADGCALIEDLSPAAASRSTAVESREGRLRVATVEHLFAALGGLGIWCGVGVWVEGPEVPLLDGAAAAWCDALEQLGVRPSPPPLVVQRGGTVAVGQSRYEFTLGPRIEVAVHVDFGDPRIAPDAAWFGDAAGFRASIAPARTFALQRDLAPLLSGGLARHVTPESVVLIGDDAIHHAGAPFAADEPARHKLLDLVGDAYLWGGPPLGRVTATRPGHAANARAFQEALERGILRREARREESDHHNLL